MRITSLGMLFGAIAAQATIAQTVLFTRSGDNAGAAFGRAVSQTGDVNSDGFSDLIVGAPLDQTDCTDNGLARVYSGKDGSVLYTFAGDQAFDYFSFAVSGGGDYNRDGVADLVVGAPQIVTGSAGFGGYVRVYSGLDGSTLATIRDFTAADAFGFSVANAEDTNFDGYDDLVVGAPGADPNGLDSGSAFIFAGGNGGLLFRFDGNAPGDQLGWSVRSALDVDHDLFYDVIVGAPGDDTAGVDAGAVKVFSGRTGQPVFALTGANAAEAFGWSVAGAGDMDGDGFPEFVIGAPGARPSGVQSGSVRVYSGKNAALLYSYGGTGPGDQVGFSVSGASDVNGDGRYDFMFGAPGAPNGVGHGRVRVLSGKDGSVLYALEGKPTASLFGFAVTGTGELNKDAHADFVVGVPNADTGGQDAGDIVQFSGRQCLATWTNYGSGWPGTIGVPALTVSDNPVICGTLDLQIENSRGVKVLGAMFLGLIDAQLPTAWDGFLLLVPVFIVPLTLPAGLVQIPIAMPCDTSLCGLTIYQQVLELDDGASKGVSFTPGLKLVLGGTAWQ